MQETTNGWQTLDATPQELSNGKFQMGPASVKEVQNGTSDCYDTDFVIGEVNGDIKLYASWMCLSLLYLTLVLKNMALLAIEQWLEKILLETLLEKEGKHTFA